MKPARLKWTVKGHKVNQANLEHNLPDLTNLMQEFAEALAQVAGDRIFERIRSGEWHRSTNPRYQSWRSWLHATGRTSRNYRAGTKSSNADDDFGVFIPGDTMQETMDRLKFNFIVRVFRKATKDPQGNLTLKGSRKRTHLSNMVDTVGAFNVSEALKKVQEIKNTYARKIQSGNPSSIAQARNYARTSINEFLQTGQHTSMLRETRMGQRIMRQAELAAARMTGSAGVYSGDEAISRGQVSKASQLFEANLKNVSSKRKPEGRSRPSISHSGGNYAFGYQTGEFATAWAESQGSTTREGLNYRIELNPRESKDQTGTMELTGHLKDIIASQGGNPQLLTQEHARTAVREALELVKTTWAESGIQIKQIGG